MQDTGITAKAAILTGSGIISTRTKDGRMSGGKDAQTGRKTETGMKTGGTGTMTGTMADMTADTREWQQGKVAVTPERGLFSYAPVAKKVRRGIYPRLCKQTQNFSLLPTSAAEPFISNVPDIDYLVLLNTGRHLGPYRVVELVAYQRPANR